MGAELWTRALFFLSALAVALLLPSVAGYVALGMFVIREIVALLIAARTARRLSDRTPLAVYPLYDFVAPAREWVQGIKQLFTPKKRKWNSKNT